MDSQGRASAPTQRAWLAAHVFPARRVLPRGVCLGASSGGVQGCPVRSSMYRRISRRTTWEGVASSSAHRPSKKAFLRGSMRIVRRAVRSSRTTAVLKDATEYGDYDYNRTRIGVAPSAMPFI